MEIPKSSGIEVYKTTNITPFEMMEFLVENNISATCSACGNPKCLIHADKDDKTVSQLMWKFTEINDGVATIIHERYFLAAMLVCDRCGFIRSFAAGKINSWLDHRHPERKQNSE